MSKTTKRFKVKMFLFETKQGTVVCRYMLTDNLLPMLVPNQYVEVKSINKLGTGRNHANNLCVFLNYLHEYCRISYDTASNKHVRDFVTYLIYGDSEDLRITDPAAGRSYSTISSYVGTITDFYRWLDQNYGSQMTFYEGERRCRTQSYLYGQIYTYKYKYIIGRSLPDVKGSREYIKWYTEDEKKLLCNHFLTLRDEAVFRLTLAGLRIDEALSVCLSSYDPVLKIVQPTRSKKRQSAVTGFENRLRKVRIADKTGEVLDRYIYEERTVAENKSRIISDVMFLNLNEGAHLGKPLSYANYRKILRGCAYRAGLDEKTIRTHSGRSTRVMEILEYNAQNPGAAKTNVQIQQLFGWASMDAIMPYMNHNSEIMAMAAYEKRRKGGERDD